MPGIFVSHASADKSLVDQFVDYVLRLGCEVPSDLIFYSSGEDTGVPSGQTLNDYIRAKLDTVSLVIAIVSPAFQARPFCAAELGAAWSRTGQLFPIAVPGLGRADMDGVLTGLVVRELNDPAALDEMHDRVSRALGLTPNVRTWGHYKAEWLARIGDYVSAHAERREQIVHGAPVSLIQRKINEWGLEDLVEHRPNDDLMRKAIRDCTEIHITCQVDSADWTEQFAGEVRAFLGSGGRLVLNVPDLTIADVQRELSAGGRFDEDRSSELKRLTANFVKLQQDPEFGSRVVVNRIPRCPAYSSVLFIHENSSSSVGYIRLYAHRMHLARDLPTLYFRYGGTLWQFVEKDLKNVEKYPARLPGASGTVRPD
jgi:hypothetical protein